MKELSEAERDLLRSIYESFEIPIYESFRFFIGVELPSKVDVCQVIKYSVEDEDVEIAIGLPGVNKEDIKLIYYPQYGVLKIKAFRRYDNKPIECELPVPKDLQIEQTKASFTNGLLVVTSRRKVPKYEIKIE